MNNIQESTTNEDDKDRKSDIPTIPKSTILVSIILPSFNEAMALPKVLDGIFQIVDERYEVIVVDDGSTDETAIIATSYPCRLIRHDSNCGKGAAVRTGLRYADGQYIIVMDADATYPVSAIPKIVKALATHDMVRCIRKIDTNNMPKVNQIGNRLFDWLLIRIIGLKGEDQLSGLYGLHRRILEQMEIESDGFDLETEIGFKANTRKLKITTFPIFYEARIGEKKLRPFRDGVNILNRILLMVLVYNPTMIFVLPGLIILGLAVIGAVVLSENPLTTPYFGLDVHSFILATLGMLGGFQLVIFGIAASLYSVEVGYKPRAWLAGVSSARVRLGASAIGMIFVLYEFLHILNMGIEWLSQGAGAFTSTRELVSAATVLVGGMQLLSAALFISIFAGRIERKQKKPHLVIGNQGGQA
jgi:glycosyltransferase involved in cell wall biosynthesis